MKSVKSYCSLKFKRDTFRDIVSGKMVSIYEDCYGVELMKDSRWSLFRVKYQRSK